VRTSLRADRGVRNLSLEPALGRPVGSIVVTSQAPADVGAPVGYRLRSEAEGRRVLETVERRFPSRREAAEACVRTYLDTFDWRLHRRDMHLAASSRDATATIVLERDGGDIQCSCPEVTPAPLARDLPAGRLREAVAPVIGARRLLPLVRVEKKGQSMRILDDEQKTVVRLVLERASAREPGEPSARRRLPVSLRLVPVRGYPAAAQRVREFLEEEVGLSPGPPGAFEHALEAVGRRAGDYSSKLDVVIPPDLTALEAVRLVCRRLLDTIVVNEDGVVRNLDPEFLHDLRVAVRRTRSAIAQLKKVFGSEIAAHFGAEFKWLGAATGSVRDLDVYIAGMEEYRASLPESDAARLAPLAEFLRRHHEAEHRALVTVLRSQRYRELIERWREYLEHAEPSAGCRAGVPVREDASKRIWRIYCKVHEKGSAVTEATPAEALHRVRIECKKLRYLMEFFRSLYDEEAVRTLIAELKRLQDSLGDFNDLEVQQDTLRRIAHQMQDEGLASVDCLLAMGRLLGLLDERQALARGRFAACFERFASRRHRALFRELFAAG